MDNNIANEAVPRAGRREWVGLAVLALPTLLLSLDLSVLYLALPSLSADLGHVPSYEADEEADKTEATPVAVESSP
jgi:hypothetical protein